MATSAVVSEVHFSQSVLPGGRGAGGRTRAGAGAAKCVRAGATSPWEDERAGGVDFSHVSMERVEHKPCNPKDPNCKVVKPLLSVTMGPGAGGRTSTSNSSAAGDPNCSPPSSVSNPVASALSAAYCVFKLLPQDAFWVNLNPNQPDKVMAARMVATETGKILLESDLWLKKSAALFLHPDHSLGDLFWKRVYGQVGKGKNGRLCYSLRQWIVPGQVKVCRHLSLPHLSLPHLSLPHLSLCIYRTIDAIFASPIQTHAHARTHAHLCLFFPFFSFRSRSFLSRSHTRGAPLGRRMGGLGR